jgi:site-specific recombinase XerD
VLYQPSSSLHQPLLQAGQRPVCDRQRRLAGVKRFFDWLEVTGRRPLNPLRCMLLPKGDKRLPTVPSEEEVVALIGDQPAKDDAADWRGRALIEILYSSGMRASETVALNWADIDREVAMVLIRHGKGDKWRSVPIGEPGSEGDTLA